MEKKKDEEKWTMPEDIVTTVTNKPEEMLYKYLVKPVNKTWTEDFRDECTGENISIERSELLFEAGDYIDESLSGTPLHSHPSLLPDGGEVDRYLCQVLETSRHWILFARR